MCAPTEHCLSVWLTLSLSVPGAGCRLPVARWFAVPQFHLGAATIVASSLVGSQGRRKPRLTSTMFGVLRAVWPNWQRRGRAFAWLLELFFYFVLLYAWVPHDTIVWKDSLWLWLWLLTPLFVADLHLLCVFDFDFWTGQPTFTRTWFRFQCLKRGRVGRELTMWSLCLFVRLSVDPQNISWAFSELSVSWCCQPQTESKSNKRK